MQNQNEDGLISQYVQKIQALAVKACSGENVEDAIHSVITEACTHFSILETSDPSANRAAFKGKLNLIAHCTHESQPKYKETLEYAASLVEAQSI